MYNQGSQRIYPDDLMDVCKQSPAQRHAVLSREVARAKERKIFACGAPASITDLPDPPLGQRHSASASRNASLEEREQRERDKRAKEVRRVQQWRQRQKDKALSASSEERRARNLEIITQYKTYQRDDRKGIEKLLRAELQSQGKPPAEISFLLKGTPIGDMVNYYLKLMLDANGASK